MLIAATCVPRTRTRRVAQSRLNKVDEPHRLGEFLASGTVVFSSEFCDVDELAPDLGAVVPLHLLTDGEWVWSAALAYMSSAVSPDRHASAAAFQE